MAKLAGAPAPCRFTISQSCQKKWQRSSFSAEQDRQDPGTRSGGAAIVLMVNQAAKADPHVAFIALLPAVIVEDATAILTLDVSAWSGARVAAAGGLIVGQIVALDPQGLHPHPAEARRRASVLLLNLM